MTPRASVVLPFRNAESTLLGATRSMLAQRGVQLELILVNDGSTDGGASVAAMIAKEDARVRVIDAHGRGIVAALRAGVAAARAPLIARMDADDCSHPERLDEQVSFLEKNERVAAVGTQVEIQPEDARTSGLARYVAWQNEVITPDEHRRALFIESPLCHPSVVLRRDALERVGGFEDPPWAEDYDLWLRLDAAGYSLAKIPRVLLAWRHAPGRATFSDPRYSLERFRDAKAKYLAPRLERETRSIIVWGAGPTGARLARSLEPYGIRASRFVDVDPRKIGRTRRGAPVVDMDSLVRERDFIVVAVGARGARDEIRRFLDARAYSEGADYVCAS